MERQVRALAFQFLGWDRKWLPVLLVERTSQDLPDWLRHRPIDPVIVISCSGFLVLRFVS